MVGNGIGYGRRLMVMMAMAMTLTGCTPASDRGAIGQTTAALNAELDHDLRLLGPWTQALPGGRRGEWRTVCHESRQSLSDWIAQAPATVTERRRKIYVLPVGAFDASGTALIAQISDHLSAFYGTPVTIMPPMSLAIPARARRMSADGFPQVLAPHLINEALPPLNPDDSVCLLAITADDIWPGGAWTHVFGIASLHERVAVCSLARLGDPADESTRRICLRRALKVSTHECGHTLSITHCVTARCGMNGAATLAEIDSQPLDFCPECAAKLAYATHGDLGKRYRTLSAWYRNNGLTDDAARCDDVAATLAGVRLLSQAEP